MIVSSTMDIYQLIELLGNATELEAERMRELLVENYPGVATVDIPDDAWWEMAALAEYMGE